MAVIALATIACADLFKKEEKEPPDNSKFYMKPPTGVTATKESGNNVHITWNAADGAGSYKISFRTNMDSEDTRRDVTTWNNPSITAYTHSYYSSYVTTGVTTFYYYIKTEPSKSGYVTSDWSDPASVTIAN